MKSVFLFAMLIIAASTAPPEPFPLPPFGDGEMSVYKTGVVGTKKVTGWGAEMFGRYVSVGWTENVQLVGDEIIWTRSDKLAGGGKRETQCIIKRSSKVRVLRFSDTLFSPAGKVESKTESDFTDPSLKYPPDMFPILCLPFLLRGANFTTGIVHEGHVWFGPMSFAKGSWTVLGRKTVTVPAGKFDCYEIEARLLLDDLGVITDTINKFLPKNYYYLNVEPPHNLIRFQSQIPGQGKVYDELVKFTPGK